MKISVLLGTIALYLALLTACGAPASALPTLMPTAIATSATEDAPADSATPTPTPEPLQVAIRAPADGFVVDLGQPVELLVSASAPVGIREVTLTSNGNGVGLHRGLGQNSLDVSQHWTPAYPGQHRVVASLTSRDGEFIKTEPITVKVVDREMLARNAPIWAEVESRVTEMRGLAPLAPVEPTLLSRTDLRQRFLDEAFYTEEDAHRDMLVMSAFDFMPRNFDLYNLHRRYVGESIAGFYDPATQEFVVLSDDDEIDGLERSVYAHEFMHALQDQHFQLALITNTSLGYDQNLALRGLAEGEAELLQGHYIEAHFTEEDVITILNEILNLRPAEVDYFPPVLSRSFIFPYTTGLAFAETLYDQGGWDALNSAWHNPPQSTEQIIHPDRYLAGDAPQIVTLAPLTDTLGIGWEQIEEDVLGEFLLREYLGQRVDSATVDRAATGWGGDRFAVYWHEANDQRLMLLRIAWDSQADSNEFVGAFATYADHTYGTFRQTPPDGGTCWQTIETICLYQWGTEILLIRAPDQPTASTVAADHP